MSISKLLLAMGVLSCSAIFSGRASAGEWFTCPADRSGINAANADPCAGHMAFEVKPVQAPRGKWWKCADEGGQCRFNGKRRVAYGAKGKWAYRVFKDSAGCHPGSFGGDPYVGVSKSCYYESETQDRPLGAINSNWSKCAGESGFCKFNGERRVAYGANGKWSYRVGRNGIACNPSKFGDPIVGVVKSCYIDPHY